MVKLQQNINKKFKVDKMKKILLFLLAAVMIMSGCESWEHSKEALAELEAYRETIEYTGSVYGMDLSIPEDARQLNWETFSDYHFYTFDLENNLYMTLNYFENDFGFSLKDFAYLNVGYFLDKSTLREKSDLVEFVINDIPYVQIYFEMNNGEKKYSGTITYLEVAGGVAAIEIYRPDFEYGQRDKEITDEILNSVSLNDIEFPQRESTEYKINDKALTLSDSWINIGTRREDDLVMEQFEYEPLTIICSVMWSENDYELTEEEMMDFFKGRAKPMDLYKINIGGSDGYYDIHDDYSDFGVYFQSISICTTGETYFMAAIAEDEDFVLPDEIYHNFAKIFEESVSIGQ